MATPSVLYKVLSTSYINDVPPCRLHSIFSSMLQETESQLSDNGRPIATVAPSTSPDVSNLHCGIIQKGARVLEMCRLDTLYDHLIPFSRWNRRARTLKRWWSFKCKLTHTKGKGKRISWTSLLQDLVKQYASWLKQPGNKWRIFVCYQRRVARMCQASATDQWYWGMVSSCQRLEKAKYLGINLSQQQKMLRLLKTVVWHDGTHEKYF